jgi:hypothetical protein
MIADVCLARVPLRWAAGDWDFDHPLDYPFVDVHIARDAYRLG